ncbi:MAG: ABC-2 family transporter protein [Patescibacteria group bacterium]
MRASQLLRVYKQLLSMNFSVLTAHRAAFANHLISGIIWGIFYFVVMLLLTNNVKSIFDWSKEEILLLAAILAIMIGIFNALFQANFDSFPNLVNKGKLDSYLLKPIDSQLILTMWNIKFFSLTRSLIGVIFIWYLTVYYHITFSWLGFAYAIPFMILGLGLYYSIWSIITTLTVWFDRATNIIELLHSLQGIMRMPPVVFREVNVVLYMAVLPLTIIAATPVGLVLKKSSASNLIILTVTSIIFMVACRKFWLFALRSYTSASS